MEGHRAAGKLEEAAADHKVLVDLVQVPLEVVVVLEVVLVLLLKLLLDLVVLVL